MSSEGTTAEREKTIAEEEREEGSQRDEAAAVEELEDAAPPAVCEVPAHLQKQPVRNGLTGAQLMLFWVLSSVFPSKQIPKEFDIDSENSEDCYMCPEYAKEIFDYLKCREVSSNIIIPQGVLTVVLSGSNS